MRKGFAPVLIILVVLAIIAVVLLGKGKLNSIVSFGTPVPSATQVDTSNWKTYINTAQNYSFNYPADWGVVPLKDTSDIIVDPAQTASDLLKKMNLGGGFGLDKHSAVMEFYGLPNNGNLDTLFASNNSQTVTKQTAIIAGQNAVVYTIKYLMDTPGNVAGDIVYATILLHRGNVLNLQINNSQYKQTYDQILSTFKFTN